MSSNSSSNERNKEIEKPEVVLKLEAYYQGKFNKRGDKLREFKAFKEHVYALWCGLDKTEQEIVLNEIGQTPTEEDVGFDKKTFDRYVIQPYIGELTTTNTFLFFLGIDRSKWPTDRNSWEAWVKVKKTPKAKNSSILAIDRFKGTWLFYFKKANKSIYRAQLHFKRGKTKLKGKNEYIKIAFYSTSSAKLIEGSMKLDNEKRLFLRLPYIEHDKDVHVTHFRAQYYAFDIDSEEQVLFWGIRSINMNSKCHSNIACMRRLDPKDITKYPNSIISGIQMEETTSGNIIHKEEHHIIQYIAQTPSIEVGKILTFDQLEEKNENLLISNGRRAYDILKNYFGFNEVWISFFRQLGSQNISIAKWTITFNPIEQKCEVIRQKMYAYKGDITVQGQGRIWIDLKNNNNRKTLFGQRIKVRNTHGILLFGTSIADLTKHDEEDSVNREILIPASLVDEKLRNGEIKEITYQRFEKEINLPRHIKMYLSDHYSSQFSYDKTGIDHLHYKRQFKAIKYAGKYMVYLPYMMGEKKGDLLRFYLTIDSLGKPTLQKQYSHGTTFEYEGSCQAMNRTLCVFLHHVTTDNKAFPPETLEKDQNLEIRQNMTINFSHNVKTPTPDVLIGYISGTDKEGWPDGSPCFAIKIPVGIKNPAPGYINKPNISLKQLRATDKKGKYKEYLFIEEMLRSNCGQKFIDNLKLNIDLNSLDDFVQTFFQKLGTIYFRKY